MISKQAQFLIGLMIPLLLLIGCSSDQILVSSGTEGPNWCEDDKSICFTILEQTCERHTWYDSNDDGELDFYRDERVTKEIPCP